jgi:hypothetical protein
MTYLWALYNFSNHRIRLDTPIFISCLIDFHLELFFSNHNNCKKKVTRRMWHLRDFQVGGGQGSVILNFSSERQFPCLANSSVRMTVLCALEYNMWEFLLLC